MKGSGSLRTEKSLRRDTPGREPGNDYDTGDGHGLHPDPGKESLEDLWFFNLTKHLFVFHGLFGRTVNPLPGRDGVV